MSGLKRDAPLAATGIERDKQSLPFADLAEGGGDIY